MSFKENYFLVSPDNFLVYYFVLVLFALLVAVASLMFFSVAERFSESDASANMAITHLQEDTEV